MTTEKSIGRHVRLGPLMDLCLECGQVYSVDGVLPCGCDGSIYKAHPDNHDGVMVALFPSMDIAQSLTTPHDGSIPASDMHVTLAYLGKMSEIDPNALARLLSSLPNLASRHDLIFARAGGLGQFATTPDSDGGRVPVYLPVSGEQIWDLRVDLVNMLDTIGVPYAREHGFTPHMTLGEFLPPIPEIRPEPNISIEFGAVTLAVGPRRISWMLGQSSEPKGMVFRGLDVMDPTCAMVAASEIEQAFNDHGFNEQVWKTLEQTPDLLGAVEKFAVFDQRAINYRPMKDTEQSCSNCVYFQPDSNMCALVAGDIRPDYLCDLWSEVEVPDPSDMQEFIDRFRDKSSQSQPISKADQERRYTFGPMYVPGREDAHREFMEPEDLQKSVWDYIRAGDRRIRLQHNRRVVAGEMVEMATWPYETEVELQLNDKVTKTILPANTPYMGVIWEPWAWELVKKGKLSGYSMGGRAHRVLVDFDSE